MTEIVLKDSNIARQKANIIGIKKKFNSFTNGRCSSKVEAYSHDNLPDIVVSGDDKLNGFVKAVHTSFANHLDLELYPDHVWTLILQGLANHVNNGPEECRKYFVNFNGKKELIVIRDDFVMGGKNDWEAAFSSFNDRIKENINNYDDLNCDFSTTGKLERCVFDITLMNTLKSFFDYRLMTKCGIPKIILKGELADWENLRNKIDNIEKCGLDWWIDELKPVIDQFMNAASGTIDYRFWKSFYKFSSMSGGDTVSGEICKFFPYIVRTNGLTRNSFNGSLKTDDFPTGMSKTPFIWEYFYTEFNMEIFAGFIGAGVEGNVVSPKLSWFVINNGKKT